ncbi:MAG: cell division protein ZapD [Gammaproteobacteria bacterium]|nr:cell division protein ZapD [Gammaproteobacteria bacterium]
MLTPHKTIYEQPTNERMRAFLRLEQLFQHIFYCLKDLSSLASRKTMQAFIDILETMDRFDVKGELLKELERSIDYLNCLRLSPSVDQEKLLSVCKKNSEFIQKLHAIPGKIGEGLSGNPLLSGIRQRAGIAGGPCFFDFPAYHHFLKGTPESKNLLFSKWLSELEPVYSALELILKLVRESAATYPFVALQGFYQQTLNPKNCYQCIRVFLPGNSPYFPEMSVGRHQMHIRFYTLTDRGEGVPSRDKLSFEMACCVI